MDTYFNIPAATLTRGLAVALALALLLIGVVAWRRRLLLRLGLRNIPRRRAQMLLIVGGLTLSTMLISCALATGDTINGALQTQVVQIAGRADEVVTQPGHDYFPSAWYATLRDALRGDPDVAGLTPVINRGGVVVADRTARQIASDISMIGVPPASSPAFGALADLKGRVVSLDALGPGEVYVNARLAGNLAAARGHSLYVFIDGRRLTMRVGGVIADDGLTGTQPAMLLSLTAMQALEGQPDMLNRVLVANAGTPTEAVARSGRVAAAIYGANVAGGVFNVDEVKSNATQTVQHAQDIFSRIFTLFTLLAVAVSLLLIFLIFTMLAAERRAEMGVTRALGVSRGGLVAMFVFEGAVYDLAASLLGLVAGLALGSLIVYLLNTVLTRLGVGISFVMTGQSMALAYCLGALCTLVAVLLSSWWVSRLNLVAAIRNLPDAPRFDTGLWSRVRALTRALTLLVYPSYGAARRPTGSAFGRTLPYGRRVIGAIEALLLLVWSLLARGIVLEPLGLWLTRVGYDEANVTIFSLGVSLVAIATGLLARWLLRAAGVLWEPLGCWADRVGYTIAGLGLLAYWVLPYDALYGYGVPRFDGAIEVFFLAGLMMVAGAVWVAIYNVGLVLRPLNGALALLGRAPLALRTAVAYPLHYTFRTGMTLAMFALVVFTLTVMSVIGDAAQQSYSDPSTMGNGFAIAAHTIYTPIQNVEGDMAASPYVRPSEFAAVGTQAYQPIGVIQLSAARPSWSLYAASVVNTGFLRGARIRLSTRARGYSSDAAVWRAVAANPRLAVIDSGALLSHGGYRAQPPIPAPAGVPIFTLSGVYQEDATMDPTPLWIAATGGGRATRVTVIGVIDARAYQTYGLFVNRTTLAAAGAPAVTPASYYFQPKAGLDVERERRRVESAFLDHGLEATVTQDEILRQQGPRMLASGMLQGYLGLTLCMGVIALGLVAARAVVERRAQIGMLRALGYPRRSVAASLLLEAGFIAVLGSVAGVALGLVLCHNLFAANFFEQYKSGMLFVVPWDQLAGIVFIASAASLLTTLIPAWQATRIAPAEAVRAA